MIRFRIWFWGSLGDLCFVGFRVFDRATDYCVDRHNDLQLQQMNRGAA